MTVYGMNVHQEMDVRLLSEKIDEYVEALFNHPEPMVREATHQLLDGIDALHREALGRIVAALSDHVELRERMIEDPVIQLVFELYGLWHEEDTASVDRALASVRPYIESHGGEVEILSVEDGVVRLRLAGACHGCSGSTMTLKRGIETALRENYENFKEMIVEQSVEGDATGNISLLDRTFEKPEKPVFLEALPIAELTEGALRGVILGEVRVLLVRCNNEIYAYKNACLDSPLPLDLGALDGTVLRCSWHGCSFDATTGVALEPVQGALVSYPVSVASGVISVATNAPGAAISVLSV